MRAKTTGRTGATGKRRTKTSAAVKNKQKQTDTKASRDNREEPFEAAMGPRKGTPPSPAIGHPTVVTSTPDIEKPLSETYGVGKPDLERLCYNVSQLVEHGGRALAACFKLGETDDVHPNGGKVPSSIFCGRRTPLSRIGRRISSCTRTTLIHVCATRRDSTCCKYQVPCRHRILSLPIRNSSRKPGRQAEIILPVAPYCWRRIWKPAKASLKSANAIPRNSILA
jgi:hypothetical protein